MKQLDAATRPMIALGEGNPSRRGVLRFVLEGTGCRMTDTAETPADLGRILALERPDIVVLDDGMGIAATQLARDMAPDAKIVLVWPSGVIPVGGDLHIDVTRIHRDLVNGIENLIALDQDRVVHVPDIEGADPFAAAGRDALTALNESGR